MKAKKGEKKGRLKKRLKQLAVYIGSQRTIVILLLAAQIVLICYMFFGIERYSAKMQILFQMLASATAVYIINKKTKSEFKIGWLVPLVAFPVFTVAIYFFLNNQYSMRVIRNAYAEKCEDTKKYLAADDELMQRLKNENEEVYRYAKYMSDYGGYPVQTATEVTYFRSGEEKFDILKDELRAAKHYIFIEMFIVDQGAMLDDITEILEQKAAEGLDVRFIYDGMGSQHLLPYNYHKKLSEKGIKTRIYQPFVPMLSSVQNNRDHRKIVVIDGHTGFTGGDNFADEYINRINRFGYWKDTSVMLKGSGVWNLTMMFMQMWEVINPAQKPSEYELYRPQKHAEKRLSEGYVLPYGDSPLDDEDVGKITYLYILYTAREYCYISTPYLILSEEMITALCYAAKRGVDVRIIVPGIPDKVYVKVMGTSYFSQLIDAGIRIYEYDGFNHAKMFVSDDTKAVVGTINLDYRSLYLHFENGCFMYNTPAVMDVKRDFENMFAEECREVTKEECHSVPLKRRALQAMLKLLEPLL